MGQSSDAQPPRTPASSQVRSEYEPTADEAELIRLSRFWMETAVKPRDEAAIETLRQIMAPDFTLQVWDARRVAVSLESWLGNRIGDGSRFSYDSLNAHVIGDIGIVYSRFWWSGSMRGESFFDKGFLLDLWRRSGQSWQVFSRRSAPIEQIAQLRQAPL